MPAAHDIYAEQLGELRRGHALYHPPRPEGPVEIGDVGYTTNGAFRRLFNVSRPAGDPVQRFGVPAGFVQLDMGAIDTYDAALEPGPLHSRAISTLSAEIGTPGEILPAAASFRFGCSSKRGAILMLETQMIRQEAVQHHYLETYLMQHCHSWHAFARSKGIRLGFGDLMLVTECSKTAAWSSVVYSNSSSEFNLSFSVRMPFTMAGVAASSSVEKIGPVERRRSQQRALDLGSPLPKNHTVFIKAYRLGMRQTYFQSLVSLFMKARRPSPSANRSDREGVTGVGPRSALSASQYFSSPPGSTELFAMRPYEPDFHASIALLGLAMEINSDSECVVLHDNFWCSASHDSDESRIMKQYTGYYFSADVDKYLNSISGGPMQSTVFPPLPMIEFTAPEAWRPNILQGSNLDKHTAPSHRRTTQISSLTNPVRADLLSVSAPPILPLSGERPPSSQIGNAKRNLASWGRAIEAATGKKKRKVTEGQSSYNSDIVKQKVEKSTQSLTDVTSTKPSTSILEDFVQAGFSDEEQGITESQTYQSSDDTNVLPVWF